QCWPLRNTHSARIGGQGLPTPYGMSGMPETPLPAQSKMIGFEMLFGERLYICKRCDDTVQRTGRETGTQNSWPTNMTVIGVAAAKSRRSACGVTGPRDEVRSDSTKTAG